MGNARPLEEGFIGFSWFVDIEVLPFFTSAVLPAKQLHKVTCIDIFRKDFASKTLGRHTAESPF